MRRTRVTTAMAAAAVLFLAACGGSEDDESAEPGAASEATAATDSFPVTVKHALGETTIDAAPQRVATVAWSNHEVPLAFGVVPVGMSKATWGDDDGDGVLPWVEERLTELGAETPVLFDETDGIDFEAVADTNPDVILAAYSGLTQEEYDTLSKIAPTVAYPEIAWGTTLEDMITTNSAALGRSAAGKQLVTELDQQITEGFAAHPEVAGKTAMFAFFDANDLSQVGFYTTHDTRPQFTAQGGMTTPKLVEERSAGTEAFYETVSAEQADLFADVDVIVTYGDANTVKTAQAHPLLSKIPAVQRGSVVVLPDSTPQAASANPSPLSIAWGLDAYVDQLGAAAAKVQ